MIMKKSTCLILAYVVALHLVTFALLVKVEAVPKIINKINMAVFVERQFDGILHDHAGVVLLGDSHTWLLGRNGQQNRGISGIMVADVPGTIPPNIAQASAILLMIGTNDIWRGKTAGLPERLDRLAAALPAGVPLIWSGIPPGQDFRFDLDEARTANKVIKTLCATRPGCEYVDTWSLLADDKGEPIPRFFVSDGVHLSADGYRVWLKAIDAVLGRIDVRSGVPAAT